MELDHSTYRDHSRTANLGFMMSVSDHSDGEFPHLVFVPSGTGNLTPFFRLAVKMVSKYCKVTFINIREAEASEAEITPLSSFVSSQPEIELLEFEMPSQTPSGSTIADPFVIRIEKIKSLLDQLGPILSSLRVSVMFTDFVLAAKLIQLSDHVDIPLYILSTTSALFFSIVASLPALMDKDPKVFNSSPQEVEIPGLEPVPITNIPPTWMNESASNYLLEAIILPNSRSLSKAKGVLLNTYDWFEAETLAALGSGRILNSLPPVFPIGPLQSDEPQKSYHLSWLNEQPAVSVVYVNFGSQDKLSIDQLSVLKKGLEISGHKYLWVRIDNEDSHESRESQASQRAGFRLRTEDNGKIVKGLVNHEEVLAHPAIGGFVNQCEWNAVMYAAWYGIPMLAWPQHGDQKMNAAAAEKAGLGFSVNDWALGGETWKEIGYWVNQIMKDINIRKKARIVRERAREAWQNGGSSEQAFVKLMTCLARGT